MMDGPGQVSALGRPWVTALCGPGGWEDGAVAHVLGIPPQLVAQVRSEDPNGERGAPLA